MSGKAATLRFVPGIHRATHRIGLYLADLGDGERELTQGEAHILAHLAASGPAKLADLHAGLAHRRSTLTSILDRLTDRGLITREIDPDDRRSFIITPTAKGRGAATRVHQHLIALEHAIADRVTEADARAFAKVLAVVEEAARERTIASPRAAKR